MSEISSGKVPPETPDADIRPSADAGSTPARSAIPAQAPTGACQQSSEEPQPDHPTSKVLSVFDLPATLAQGESSGLPRCPTPSEPEPNPVVQRWQQVVEPLRRYAATRAAIRAGEPLYDYSADRLATSGFMGPWTFNMSETAIAVLPISLIMKVLNFVWPVEVKLPANTPELARRSIELQSSVAAWLQPLIVPLALMLIAGLAAWGSLHKKDLTPERRRRAKYAYLYFDGAYGLVPQFCFALALTLSIWLTERDFWRLPFGIAVAVLGLYAWVHTIYLTCIKEPKLLFVLNGYSPKPIYSWTIDIPPNPAPWTKYGVSVLIGGGCAAYLVSIIVVVLIVAISLALAIIQMRVTA